MQLKELVSRYRELSRETGEAVTLTEFALPKEEFERELAAFDDDYHISRFFEFSRDEKESPDAAYNINGVKCTHLKILPGIDGLL